MANLRSWISVLAMAAMVMPAPSWAGQAAPDDKAKADASSAASTTLAGYNAADSATERATEKIFRDGVVAANIRDNMQRLSARPHHVGSPYDKDNAEWILARMKEWGFDAHIETFNVLFPTPKERVVELVAPTTYKAKLQEPPIAIDPTSSQTSEQLPTYNAYSIDGDVTGPLVYVNYGNREDYEQLDRLGISVKGAIVIARYGAGWRGIKPKVAGEHGAIGCIIYSDPRGDSYFQGDQYPKGGWRPAEGVQRGSVMDTDYPGDPLTPGVAATADAKRLTVAEATTITKIPVLPISYTDAQPLLAALDGPMAQQDWRGALPHAYHIGPGPAKVHLKVSSNWDIKPIYDVIGTLHGSDDGADAQWVIRGNHHDAWVNGADDPISGQSAMLEEARQLGAMHKQGWTPKRTIIYCAWDGEEPGLLGSVEWVEAHLAELKQHAIVYFNSDSSDRGILSAGGTQDLQSVVSAVAHDVDDPETHMSVYERAHLNEIGGAKTADERATARARTELDLYALGDGSDFTAFQDFAGVSTADMSYGGESDADQYHSIYDDFYWYTHFVDPNFLYERAIAQTQGTAVLRMADADLVPVTYSPQAEAITKYEGELESLLKDKQEEITERNLELKEGVYTATADPTKKFVPPPVEQVPPYMNFTPMKNAIAQLKLAADHYGKALAAYQASGSQPVSGAALATVNGDILRVSRLFLNEKGLPERPWFKNQVYAPGAYTGYGAKPIAAVREYMDEKKWSEAEGQIPMVAGVLTQVALGIEKCATDLEAATPKK